jgi:hypothetical protein
MTVCDRQDESMVGTDAVWRSESHSHCGFSPVDQGELLSFRNRFNGFRSRFRGISTWQTVETVGSLCEGVFDHRAKAAV